MSRWIVVRNWDKYQHYKDRNPVWIKLYTELLHDDAWLRLTWQQRGILSALWLEYASARGQVREDTVRLTRALGGRVTSVQLKALNEAGFIEFSSSKPLAFVYTGASATRAREEKRREALRVLLLRAVVSVAPRRRLLPALTAGSRRLRHRMAPKASPCTSSSPPSTAATYPSPLMSERPVLLVGEDVIELARHERQDASDSEELCDDCLDEQKRPTPILPRPHEHGIHVWTIGRRQACRHHALSRIRAGLKLRAGDDLG